jgi:creatinine amidohydrolase
MRPDRGMLLEQLTWKQAEEALTPEAVVVLPLGAAAKEHGPHLRLNNDFLMVEYLKKRVLAQADVVVLPTLGYSYYPAFAEYPGSTTLRKETARDVFVDVCRSVARHGPKRFYVLNTGVSTNEPLRAAAEILAAEGIVLRFTNLVEALKPLEKEICQQEGGTHADEVETSIMLYITPGSVDMTKARKDFNADKPGPLTRDPKGEGTYSPTGAWGDPTLATREKGQRFVDHLVASVLADLEQLRAIPIPRPATTK